MKFNKKIAAFVAAGALCASAVPAMAFENEFHGSYVMRYMLSNWDNGGGAPGAGGGVRIEPTQKRDKNIANEYFEQRFRLMYTAKASDDLKLVSAFELDTKFGGDKTGKYGVSSDAGVLDADGIMLETKWVYLDFNLGKSVNVKTGVMPISDSFKGMLTGWTDDAGILVTTKLGNATIGTGYFRLATESSKTASTTSYFSSTAQLGQANKDLAVLDASYAINKDLKVGAAFDVYADYTSTSPTLLYVFGLNGEGKVGPATISGFVGAQTGYTSVATVHKSISAYAANLAAKMPIGPGTLSTTGLFVSGDGNPGNNHVTTWQNTGNSLFPECNLWLLARTGAGGTTSDMTINGVNGPGNKGQWLYALGYNANITPKLSAGANVGLAWVAKNANLSASDPFMPRYANARYNGSNFQGTEINAETGYKIYNNLTAKVIAAYAVLGGYYKGSALNSTATNVKDPENPYSARLGLYYTF